jgi:hypothetical protein
MCCRLLSRLRDRSLNILFRKIPELPIRDIFPSSFDVIIGISNVCDPPNIIWFPLRNFSRIIDGGLRNAERRFSNIRALWSTNKCRLDFCAENLVTISGRWSQNDRSRMVNAMIWSKGWRKSSQTCRNLSVKPQTDSDHSEKSDP